MIRYACEPLATVEQFLAASCGCKFDAGSAADRAEIAELIDAASDTIYLITNGNVKGRCEVKVRPVRSGACDCFTTTDRCVYCDLDGLPLPGQSPAVAQVKVDGVVVDPASYAIMRTGGGPPMLVKVASTDSRPTAWPQTQPLWRPDTDTGTFSVTLRHGLGADEYVVWSACVELACQLAKDFDGQSNALPMGARSVTAQGVSVQLESRAQAIKDGHQSLPKVARLMSTHGGRSGGVFTPDTLGGWEFVVTDLVS